MRRYMTPALFAIFACGDTETPEKQVKERSAVQQEGSQQGDCEDGEDNDNNGRIDCDDLGCVDKPACSDAENEAPESEVSPPEATFSISWENDSVTLTLTVDNGLDAAEYYWGITETGSNCGYQCWTGEDCFEGFELTNGNVLNYCHPVSETGGELFYGGDSSSLAEGSETVFQNDSLSEATTHIIDDRGSDEGPCWVWGNDISYYSGYAKTCIEM